MSKDRYCPNLLYNIDNDISIGYVSKLNDIDKMVDDNRRDGLRRLYDLLADATQNNTFSPKMFVICNWYLPEDSPDRYCVAFCQGYGLILAVLNSELDDFSLDSRATKALYNHGAMEALKKYGEFDTTYVVPYQEQYRMD